MLRIVYILNGCKSTLRKSLYLVSILFQGFGWGKDFSDKKDFDCNNNPIYLLIDCAFYF